MNRTWFEVKGVEGMDAELSIFDEIGGWGVPVSAFKAEFDLVKHAASVRLTLNSPGGNVFDGMALYNILSTIRPKLTVEVVGAAASIASIIALAGKQLVMDEGSYFMIHKPFALTVGDDEEHLARADLLEKMGEEMANLYASRSGMDKKKVLEAMKAETWYSAKEAVAAGFATSVGEHQTEAVAAIAVDFRRFQFRHIPEALLSGNSAQATAEAGPAHVEGETTHEEAAMELSKVMEFLGSAKSEEKEAILEALGAKAMAKENTDLKAQVATLTEALTAAKAKEDELAKADLAKRKEIAIKAAMDEGRLLPKDKAQWETLFDEQPDFAEKAMKLLPKAVDYKVHGNAGGGGEDPLEDADRKAAEAQGMSIEDYKKYMAEHNKAAKQDE